VLVDDLATRLAEELRERFDRLDRPFDGDLVRAAVDACRQLAHTDEEPTLANRDFHLGNVLAAEREPWLLIDPKPLVGEPAFDTGHLLRTLLPERLERDAPDLTAGRLAPELDLEPGRVIGWVLARSVDDALWDLPTGGQDVGWDVRCSRLLVRAL